MNRVALDLGFIKIYWYSICIMVGMAIGIFLVVREAKKQNVNKDFLSDLIFYTILLGIVGARFYYVVFHFDYYFSHLLEIFEIWNGGLAIHGGILFGAIFVLYYTRKYHVNTLKLMDICVIGLIVGQIFGRWGNFFNQEAYGPITSQAFLESLYLPSFIIKGMYIDGFFREPTFLYESLWNFVGFGILLIFRRMRQLKVGQLSGFYLMWYSLGRFCVESLRTDSLMLGSLKMAQIASCFLFLLGFFLFLFRMRSSDSRVFYHEKEDH